MNFTDAGRCINFTRIKATEFCHGCRPQVIRMGVQPEPSVFIPKICRTQISTRMKTPLFNLISIKEEHCNRKQLGRCRTYASRGCDTMGILQECRILLAVQNAVEQAVAGERRAGGALDGAGLQVRTASRITFV